MIEIDKQDFLYKHLQKLGVENEDLDRYYIEYAGEGVACLKDFKAYLYSKYAETVKEDIDESFIEEMVPYYQDLKKIKNINKQDIKKMLIEYKSSKDNSIKEQIINSKLKSILFMAYMYKLKYQDVEIMDIVQVCNLGLMEAIEKYDDTSRVAFDDYIEFWINVEVENNFTKEKK